MALNWTTPADVKGRWIGESQLTATDPQIEMLLDDAEDTVLGEFPDMQKRIDRAAGTDTSDGPSTPKRRVVKVVSRMVIRHLRNPEGVRQIQEGAGPFQRSKTLGGTEPGALYLTDEDRAELGGHKAGGALTVDTTPRSTSLTAPDTWFAIGRTYL